MNKYERTEEYLRECVGVSDQTINIACYFNGISLETLNDILYYFTGYRDIEQIEQIEG